MTFLSYSKKATKGWLRENLPGILTGTGETKLEDILQIQEFRKTEHVATPDHRPRNISEAGVRESVLEDIALKSLYTSGPFSVLDLAEHMRVPFEVGSELFNRLRGKLLCEVTGMTGNIPFFAITSQGRSRALELLSHSQYAGPAPVSLASYVEQVRKQSVRNVEVHPPDVERAFAHMVIDEKTLGQFGTALNSGSAIFLYGPPGVGKTAIAETLSRVLAEDAVWVPYAIEVDAQVITVFDPAIHKRTWESDANNRDLRWVRCHRPTVMVGGELTAEMLDLQFNPINKFYVGPMQMKANNGVLIIDDLGRQRIRPDELLNRWVVPLDRRIEFLTLAGGRKIEIPFEMLVVFASNLDPSELLDPAFLRRIQTKIRVGAVTDEQFCEIFRRVAREHDIEADPVLLSELITVIRGTLKQELRGCFPRDLVNQICWSARYEGRKPMLDHAALMRAVDAYFLNVS
jgi:predicted ATPase with chaperone activity